MDVMLEKMVSFKAGQWNFCRSEGSGFETPVLLFFKQGREMEMVMEMDIDVESDF